MWMGCIAHVSRAPLFEQSSGSLACRPTLFHLNTTPPPGARLEKLFIIAQGNLAIKSEPNGTRTAKAHLPSPDALDEEAKYRGKKPARHGIITPLESSGNPGAIGGESSTLGVAAGASGCRLRCHPDVDSGCRTTSGTTAECNGPGKRPHSSVLADGIADGARVSCKWCLSPAHRS